MLDIKKHTQLVKLFSFSKGATSPTNKQLVDEMISKFDDNVFQNPNSKFLDPCGGTGTFMIIIYQRLLKYHTSEWILKNMIYIVDKSRVNCDLLKKIGFINVYNEDFLKIDFKDMKFDNIVMNPPYKGGLHIEIFNKAFEQLNDGGTVICVHPSTPFINRKPTKEDGKTQKIKEIVSKHKTRLTLVDGNKIFDAGFFTPLSITRVEKVLDEKIEVVYSHIDSTNKEVKVYDKLDDIFIHGNDLVIGIYNKIIPNIKVSLENMLYRNGNISSKYIKLARISGHPPKPGETMINPDFFQLIYKANETDLDDIIVTNPVGKRADGNQFNELMIKDTDNVNYIHSYLMTKFSRFCLSLYKNSANILSDLGAVPYMDFSQEWTDEKLFDYFELTEEERNFINEYIPNWYERDFK